jgi:hypothetical protein
MSQVNRTEYITNALDEKTPYKITAPKHSALPIRLDSKSAALNLFEHITEQGIATVLTYNCPITKVCRILKTGPQTIYSLAQEE